jgi:hypothetical protein
MANKWIERRESPHDEHDYDADDDDDDGGIPCC